MTRRPAKTVRTDTKVETSVVEASRSLNSAVLGMAGPGGGITVGSSEI